MTEPLDTLDYAGEPATEAPKSKLRLPRVPWTPKDTIWGLVGGLLLAIIIPPLLVAPFDPDLESDGALLAAQAIFDGLLFLVALGMASQWKFRPLGRTLGLLGMRRFELTAIGIMVATLVAYYIAAGLFASLVLKPEQEDVGGELGIGNPSLLIAITAVLAIVVVAPVTEELFFRGFLFAGLRSRRSLWPAALLSGLIFGLVHATTGITTVVPLAALGVALCWLYDRTGSLWPCVMAHMINNGLALAVVS
jgi:CAAX protease family protein